jgi:periplasmic mercuric ion binding protein
MRLLTGTVLAGLFLMGGVTPLLRADTTVELKGVHLCCPACVKAVSDILKKEGATGKCDAKAKTVTLTAKDDAAAQKALDALATGGFSGETDNKDLKIKEDSGVEKGNVKSLTVTGVHNCCGACCKAIKETVKKVDGVKGDTAKPKADTFEVTGDFDAAELVKALNTAGFHVKVKK